MPIAVVSEMTKY